MTVFGEQGHVEQLVVLGVLSAQEEVAEVCILERNQGLQFDYLDALHELYVFQFFGLSSKDVLIVCFLCILLPFLGLSVNLVKD